MCIELLFSYLSILGRKNIIFEKCFAKERCAPTDRDDIISVPENPSLYEINAMLDASRLSMDRKGRNVVIYMDDIWCVIWYAIIINSTITTSFDYQFRSSPVSMNAVGKLSDLFNYSKIFADKVFVV